MQEMLKILAAAHFCINADISAVSDGGFAFFVLNFGSRVD
jgi:hypothetical protein